MECIADQQQILKRRAVYAIFPDTEQLFGFAEFSGHFIERHIMRVPKCLNSFMFKYKRHCANSLYVP